jgi:hypothetical protein
MLEMILYGVMHWNTYISYDSSRLKWHLIHLHILDRPIHTYSSTTNKMRRYTMVFITINAVHVSGGSSAHHQELKTVYTASGICRVFFCFLPLSWVGWNPPTIAVKGRKSSTITRCCVYCFELLMMGGGTA